MSQDTEKIFTFNTSAEYENKLYQMCVNQSDMRNKSIPVKTVVHKATEINL